MANIDEAALFERRLGVPAEDTTASLSSHQMLSPFYPKSFGKLRETKTSEIPQKTIITRS
jgi:hypothetical protein